MTTQSVLAEVAAERTRQDAQWGGPPRDDALPVQAFVQLIGDYAGWARVKAREGSMVEARQRLVQAAALAVAAVESLDRRASGATEAVPSSPGLNWE
ncbi:hypothetical protein [Falsiroseomonas oryziterrae]|uniref:hypothetical protein n=1 Tax=Falsiroseomonas oryziterrae TaxID=2911368 RepID=UPI001F1F4D3C|nr:hypothetical protein [Roseomonas sp. NPKOSM-4]